MENNQPLISFCLPHEVIKSMQFNPTPNQLSSNKLQFILNEQTEDEKPTNNTIQQEINSTNSSNLGCTMCQIQFDSTELQRQHYRSDWHRFNLKLNTDHPSKKSISQDEFLSKLEQLNDSLSGSEDSDSDSDLDDDDNDNDNNNYHSNLTHQFQSFHIDSQLHNDRVIDSNSHHNNNNNSRLIGSSSNLPEEEEPGLNSIKLLSPTSPIAWFNIPGSSILTSDQPSSSSTKETEIVIQLGFYRCIFPKTFLQEKSLKTHQQEQLGELYKSELSQLQHNFLPSNFSFKDDLLNLSNEEEAEEKDLINKKDESPPIWTLLMIGGGHFAAMVVSMIPKQRHIGKNKPPEIEPVILLHKTFHRYTTRRKQGGGQASHDAGGKGAAKSAGANLRRYNEQALAEDIQDLLNSWSDKIKASNLIFIRSSKSNLKLFFNNKNNNQESDHLLNDQFKLNRGDDRIRSFPFVTKRPTFNELKRCFSELTRVKVIKTTKEELMKKEIEIKAIVEREKMKIEVQKKKKLEQEERIRIEEEKKRKEKVPKEITKEEKEKEIEITRWERIIEIIKKGKLEQLEDFIKKHDQIKWLERIPSTIIEEADLTNGCVSLLQIASMADQAEVVEWMLSEGKTDPTIKGSKVGTKGNLTAYELANSKNTRNAFRRVMAKEPERWDWIKEARVPSGLTQELELNHATKNKEWKNKMKEKIKEREKIKFENEKIKKQNQEIEKLNKEEKLLKVKQNSNNNNNNSTINRLGSTNNNRLTNLHSHLNGLTDAQRATLERERRARAAEARLK